MMLLWKLVPSSSSTAIHHFWKIWQLVPRGRQDVLYANIFRLVLEFILQVLKKTAQLLQE